MAGELPDDVRATLSILDQPQPDTPAKLKPTRTMDDIALPIRAPRADDVQQTLSILDGNTPPETNSEPNQRDVEADVLKLALRKGINSNTALAAHRKNVAQRLNINPALVTPQAEESAFYQDHDPTDLQKNYPALAKYLQVDGNAELVGKNIDPLKEVETFYRRAVQDPEIMLSKGVVAAAQTVIGLGNLVSAGKAGKYVEDHGIDLKKVQSVLTDLYTPEAQAALKKVAEAKGFTGTLAAAAQNPSAVGLMVGESLPQMYLGRVFGGALKAAFPSISFGTAGAAGEGITMAGGSAEQIRRETDTGELTGGQAALAVGVGVIGTGLSKFGNVLATKLGIEDVDAAMVAGKLLTRLEDSGVPKQLAVRLIGGAAIEGGVEEMPQSVTEQIAQNVALGRPWDEGVPENAAIGLVTGGAMGAAAQVGAVRGKAPTTIEETPAEKQARATIQNSILRTAAAVNAEEQRNALKEWGKRVSADNPLRKESPQSFKEFVRTMADENGAIKEVFVDAKLLNETLGQAGIDKDKLAADMPEVAESLNEALVTNGEVRIPIEDYATHIVGTPVESAIIDHLRTTPDGMTYAESQVFFQQQQEDFIKQAEALVNLNEPVLTRKEFAAQAPDGMQYKDYLAAHKNKVEVFATDLQEVHDSLLTGLESTGRFPKSISRVYAIPFREFYATNAARMGILPTELYKSLPLNFAKMQTADILAPSVLSQDEIEKRLVAQHNISVPNLIHADRMGGLAAPSLAITDKAHTFDSFGDITLISSKDMIDPRSGAKVFGADIYSPRYPRVDYAFSKDRVVRLNEQLKDQFALTNEKPIEVYDINGDASDAARTLENNAAVMAAFLESKKIKPKLAKVKKRAIPRWALKYADKTMYSYIDTPAFIEDVAKHTEHIDEILSRAENEEERSLMRRRLANSKAYEIDAYRTDRPNFGKVDPKASLSEMNRQIYDKGLHKEYTSYVYNLTLSMNPTERIFKGFTNSGSRKYIPHTIDNVIAELRKNLRGGENFNYGLGSIRARYTPQFKTLEQIRKAEGKLLSSEDFERVKTELDSEFNAVLEELTRYYKHKGSAGFGLYEIGSQALTDAASLGVPRALKENQFENVPQEAQNRIADFLAKLADVPAEYFEVKLLRQVGLQEFSGAVVPKNAGQNVIDILKKNGITDIKFYKPQDKADRLAKVNEFNDMFFQSAFYSALQREIPSISKIADKNGMVKADQALSWVEARQKEGKFKLEEVEAVGLKDWLQATEGKVSVADIENFVAANGVQIEEKLLGEPSDEINGEPAFYEYDEEDNDYAVYSSRIEQTEHYDTRAEAMNRVDELNADLLKGETKFEAYKLPGGENYRELLLTLPKTDGQDFKSAHYDEKNILAHVRFDDRTNPTTGQKILFIEEIQSDWAQEGRKKGFTKPSLTLEESKAKQEDVFNRFDRGEITEEQRNAELLALSAARDESFNRTPAAPFVQNTKSWVALAVKRMLRYAAENGYDQVAWTTGEQQAARYDLSKQISEIRYSHGYLKAYDLDNNLVLNKSSVREDELPDIIGKEVAKKLLDQPEEGPGKMRVLSGLDLKVGGEGMLAFYDKLLPQVVSDVAKKLGGGKVGVLNIGQPKEPSAAFFVEWAEKKHPSKPRSELYAIWGRGEAEPLVRDYLKTFDESMQPSLEITPEMRDKIMSGLPLFQGQRAGFDPSTFTMSLLKGADLSSVIHEGAHFYLEALADLAGRDTAPQQIKDDFRTTLEWFGIMGNEVGVPGGSTLSQNAKLPDTINIDGIERPTTNSEGRPIYPTEEGIRNFWKRFGDSKARERPISSRQNTKMLPPLVFYHGTKGGFNTFKVGAPGNNSNVFGTWSTKRAGLFFTVDSKFAGGFSTQGEGTQGANVIPVYLIAKNPIDLTQGFEDADIEKLSALGVNPRLMRRIPPGEIWGMFDEEDDGGFFVSKLKEAGYDSAIITEPNHDTGEDVETWVVFDPDQVKSAIGNNGDFSASPNILEQGGETPPPGQLPPGRTPEEIWRSMTLDQKRPYHEQWAQSYERYTMEGKAPTVEMQSVFSRFREWMLSVYKSMKDFLAQNPLAGKLNDDIRGVFDRLIASEDKIYQAEEARGYAALFGSAAEAGLSEKEFEDYQNLGKLASTRAVDEMNARSIRDMRWLSNAKDKAIKKLQAEANTKRAAIKAQVTDEVDAMPLNRARNFLTKGEFIDENGVRRESDTKFKLNTEEVKALSNGQVPANLENMVAPDGIGLELAAKLLGFQSPETLIGDLANGESRDVTIQGLTDQRMLEQYGDLTDDKAIERAAEKAIHNDARARFMATGLKILSKTELSAAQLNRAAKMAAEATIAKKKIRALTPGQFTRAEAKANREALENVARDPKKAIDAQRAALLNNRLAKAALEAAEDVDSILKYFKKFESKGVRKAVGIDQIDQIDDLLQYVDRDKNTPLKEIDKRQALADWVAEQEADGFEPVLDPVLAEQIKTKHYKDMTVDELRMLRDTVKQIEHVGRLKRTLLTEMGRADFRARVEEAENSIRDNANRTVEERGTPTDVAGLTSQWVRQMFASHRKFSSFIREMDGGRDGGVMWHTLGKPMNAAGDSEVEMRRASSEALSDLFKGFTQDKTPLNLYAKRMKITGTDIAMTQEQRIMFAMNWGNEGNRQRLLDGGITGKRALSINDANAILDTLTKPEWDFVQGVWDHIATYKDQIAALERKITGIEPEWVEPAEIKTKHGTYRGGYFPAKYDIELSSRSESLEAAVDMRMGMKGAFNTAATRSGYTKARSEAVMNRPLLLSYNVIANHISEVTHRLAWQPWLIDANRLLKALDAPIRQHYGAEVLREMRNTVIDIAAGDVGARTPMERAINHLRTGSTIVGMGWRFSTAFLQPSGLAQSWARIGGRWMAKGIAETFKNLNSASELVNSKSSLMRNRDITMNREVRDVLDRIRTNEGLNAVTGSYFSLIGKMQRVVDIPTWLGAYEKALHDLKLENAVSAEERAQIESDAVALADQAVIDSQSGGQLKDLASIQRGHPGLKLFTNFYSYFSATYNLNIEALRRTNFRSPTDLAFLAGDLVLLNIIPVLFATALKEMTKGKCGDDLDCLVKSYGYEQAGYMFGQMILLRDMGSAALVAAGGDQYGYSGPAGLRFFSDLYKAGVQVNQGELDWPLFKSLSNTTGVLLHLPTGQVNTTLEGIMAVENGDVEGVSILPALLFGPPKEGK